MTATIQARKISTNRLRSREEAKPVAARMASARIAGAASRGERIIREAIRRAVEER